VSALAWWLVPAVATILAVLWVSWHTRTRPPQNTHDALAARERFRQAMERAQSAGTPDTLTGQSRLARPPTTIGDDRGDTSTEAASGPAA
jgi:hypothetical protein